MEKNTSRSRLRNSCACGVCQTSTTTTETTTEPATTTQTTSTTYAAGTVTTYEPGRTVVVKGEQGPVSFALGTAARVVDGAGKIVTAPLRAGQKVRVYYTGPRERVVERVVVEDKTDPLSYDVASIGWSRIQKPQGRNDPAAFYFPTFAQIVAVDLGTIANVATALTVLVGVVFGLVEMRRARRDREERAAFTAVKR